MPEDGSPLVIPFEPSSTISRTRFTVDKATSTLEGLAELVVNSPPDVALPDVPPASHQFGVLPNGFTYEKTEPPTTEAPSP